MFFHQNEPLFGKKVTLTAQARSGNKPTILPCTHFEKANSTFVAEHNIISAIALCIQKAASSIFVT